jgi:hypothetical protein
MVIIFRIYLVLKSYFYIKGTTPNAFFNIFSKYLTGYSGKLKDI